MDPIHLNCDIVRDLLPLCADGLCSAESNAAIEAHIRGCPACAEMLASLNNNDFEKRVKIEKRSVISGQFKRMNRRWMIRDIVFSLIFGVPTLVCLIVNLASGHTLDWFFIVLASLLLTASLTAVPFFVSRRRFLTTLGAATLSLILLLATCAIYTRGRWFFVAATATLFGLALIFLPIAVRKYPFSYLFRGRKLWIVLGIDTFLYAVMMLAIGFYVCEPGFFRFALSYSFAPLALAWCLPLIFRAPCAGIRSKLGVSILFSVTVLLFGDLLNAALFGLPLTLPPLASSAGGAFLTFEGVQWLILLASFALSVVLVLTDLAASRRHKNHPKDRR